MMSNCTKCGNAIFDPLWGDYKCSIFKHAVYNYEHVGCKEYKKGEPMESKSNEERGES